MTEQLPPREDLLALFDAEARRMSPAAAEGRPFTFDGPVMRIEFSATGVIRAPNDLQVDGPRLEALIERQVQYFAERGKPVEWKTYADDRPDSLIPLLLAAGFEPEPVEAVMVAPSAMEAPHGLDEVHLREAGVDEAPQVAELLREVWDADHDWIVAELERLHGLLGPDGLRILVAEADGRIVSAGWVILHPDARFAGLWGGSTHPAFRRRGIYRAMVAARARIAAEHGIPYLRVDASAMSRPVLHTHGFVELTTTTPYVWRP